MKDIEFFTEFLDNIEAKKGWYFNSNYMHEQIFVSSIKLDWSLVEYLYHYREQMQSIKTLNCAYNDKNKILNTNILNTITLSGYKMTDNLKNKIIAPHFDPRDNFKIK